MVPLSAGQLEAIGGPVVLVGEGRKVEFLVGVMIEEAEPEGVIEEPPLGPVGMVGDPIGNEEVAVVLPEAESIPVEGPTTVVVDPSKVVVEKTDDAEVGTPVLVPTGTELFATGILDGGGCTDEAEGALGELTVLAFKDDDGGRPELTLLVGIGMAVDLPGPDADGLLVGVELLAEEPDSERPPPEIDGLPIGPVDENGKLVPNGVEMEIGNPFEGVDRGRTDVPLLEGAGKDEEAGGAVGISVVDETGVPEDERDEDEREPGLSGPVEKVGEGRLPVDEAVMLG